MFCKFLALLCIELLTSETLIQIGPRVIGERVRVRSYSINQRLTVYGGRSMIFWKADQSSKGLVADATHFSHFLHTFLQSITFPNSQMLNFYPFTNIGLKCSNLNLSTKKFVQTNLLQSNFMRFCHEKDKKGLSVLKDVFNPLCSLVKGLWICD